MSIRDIYETHRRLKGVLDRINLRHPPFPIRLVLRDPSAHGVELAIICTVRDRDTGQPRDVAEVAMMSPHAVLDFDDDTLIERLMDRLTEIGVHEMREMFHVDGVRRFDPHAGER